MAVHLTAVAETWLPLVRRLAANIREWRLSKDWSQARLALKAGISLRRVQQIEAGGVDANPSLKVVHQLARALGTTAAELLGDEAPPTGRRRAPKAR